MNLRYTHSTVMASLAFMGLLSSCQQETFLPQEDVSANNESVALLSEASKAVVPNMLRVRFDQATADKLGLNDNAKGSGELRAGGVNNNLEVYMQEAGIEKMTRLFPANPKYPKSMHEMGLDRWYDITFKEDEGSGLRASGAKARKLPGAEVVEEIRLIQIPDHAQTVDVSTLRAESMTQSPFNDPMFERQWGLNNTGDFVRSKAGYDLNVLEAWKTETGKPNVIVSIVDGGIDTDHEDLINNMWINEVERLGQKDVDDDHNGYVDDIFGYNFVTMTGQITDHDHGTHVAGIVAARNNNGIGVSGIAGGDGNKDSGIRLMSSQVYAMVTNPSTGVPSSTFAAMTAPEAYVHAAQNGAVISQNSWGYVYPGPGQIEASLRDAIDYFRKYAGCDDNGEQLKDSPMKGGIVIFAAGNDGLDYECFPAAYPPCIAVTAHASDGTASYFSNRGDWVDIAAPGGSAYYDRGQILSTLPGDKYGYMQGTSQACPMVSGVAALIVSKFGGPGFTLEECEKRLLTALRPYDIYLNNPQYRDRLGVGYVDANAALEEKTGDDVVVESVTTASIKEADYTSILLSISASKVGEADAASTYKVYLSANELTTDNYAKAEKVIDVSGRGYKAGETLEYRITNLAPSTTYYVAIVPFNRWGKGADKPFFTSGTTNENRPPVITSDLERFVVVTKESKSFEVQIEDPEGTDWTYTVSGDKSGVSYRREGNKILFEVMGIASPGEYNIKIEATDELNAKGNLTIPFVVRGNQLPEYLGSEDQTTLLLGEDMSLNLRELFSDPDEDALTFTVNSLTPDNVSVSLGEDGILVVHPTDVGTGAIECVATDMFGGKKQVMLAYNVIMADGNSNSVLTLYQTENQLNVTLTQELQSPSLQILSVFGDELYSNTLTADENGRGKVTSIDISSLSKGQYMLWLKWNGGEYKTSFIKK